MRRRATMLFGLALAFTGDYFLVVRQCGVRDAGFLCGIAAFACAHLLWAAANWKESKVAWQALPAVLLPVLGFFVARVRGHVPPAVLWAATAYAVVSACSLAVALGTRRWLYSLGIGCLVLSDVFIACHWARAPHWGAFIGPVYVASLLCVVASLCAGDREPRFVCGRGNPLPATALGGLLSVGFFVWAMAACPGKPYNPLLKMLSYLGRTEIAGVAYPPTHYLFCLGMAAGAGASLYFAPHFGSLVAGWRRRCVGWGMAVCAGGLLLIAFVPENVNMSWHNGGCYCAAGGGAAVAVALAVDRMGWIAGGWMLLTVAAFQIVFCLSGARVLPFSPYVTSAQKLIIASFVLWQLAYAIRLARERRAKG